MPISTATFIKDSILLLRNSLRTNITDPISASRPANSSFVMTSYPKKNVVYPMISVRSENISHIQRLGIQSEGTHVALGFEIRVWTLDEVQKDALTQQVYDYLRDNQITGDELSSIEGLHDFTLNSAVNIDEDAESGVRSKVLDFTYAVILV